MIVSNEFLITATLEAIYLDAAETTQLCDMISHLAAEKIDLCRRICRQHFGERGDA